MTKIKLVLEYDIGDGCTFSCTVTKPIFYSSAEALLCDLEAVCKKWHVRVWKDRADSRPLPEGPTINPGDFFFENVFQTPTIMTVDEWFEKDVG